MKFAKLWNQLDTISIGHQDSYTRKPCEGPIDLSSLEIKPRPHHPGSSSKFATARVTHVASTRGWEELSTLGSYDTEYLPGRIESTIEVVVDTPLGMEEINELEKAIQSIGIVDDIKKAKPPTGSGEAIVTPLAYAETLVSGCGSAQYWPERNYVIDLDVAKPTGPDNFQVPGPIPDRSEEKNDAEILWEQFSPHIYEWFEDQFDKLADTTTDIIDEIKTWPKKAIQFLTE
jgi:hypothetical protein